ncbi:Uncharacterised protein [uncultured archaeon]|nr:Uncharacterised protein [uncultured archaeon]
MNGVLNEAEVEEHCLNVLSNLGYEKISGPIIASDGVNPERKSYQDVILVERLRTALENINSGFPKEAIDETVRKVLRFDSQNLITNNEKFHKLLVDGVDVEFKKNGKVVTDKVWLVDFKNVKNNEFWVVNQFTIIEENNNRRPDVILFVNGIPLVVFELKSTSSESASLNGAFNQFETYKVQIPSLFNYNEILIVSDGLNTKAGSLTANFERFSAWKTVDGIEEKNQSQLELLINGMLKPEILLDYIRHFIVFEKNKDGVAKKIAAYHQYNAVNHALESTKEAIKGSKKAGVVWHTQGSGKSLTMGFYTGKLVLELDNPTIVVLTDRNDLDGQLFENFGKWQQILRQKPVHADSREKIKELLKVASGGIVFTTIQKFMPEEKLGKYPLLSDRKNIVVVADEAHRSQYEFIDGFAKHLRDALPNASFIGFTGTPIEKSDRSTLAVFGKCVDTYDIYQAVEDGATVPIYLESRLAKLELKPEERPKIDYEFEEVTEGEESNKKEKLKSKWSRLENIVGSKNRIKRIASDLVEHYESRSKILEGKAMFVCMSRRICIELHDEIIKLRPNWYDKNDDKGIIKVIMTGSASDGIDWQEHIRNKQRREKLAERLKNPKDELKIVLVRDMWLTGFDAPCLHTMYVDKPMKEHNLMQAIARVNRVFKDKPGGLIVDYIGIGYELKKALSSYSAKDRNEIGLSQADAIKVMKEKLEVVQNLFHGFNYKRFFNEKPSEKMKLIPQALNHVLKQENGKERFTKNTTQLIKAFTLACPSEEAMKIKEEVGFFQLIKTSIQKITSENTEEKEDYDSAIQQIISKAIISDRVIDIFEAAGVKKPNVTILSNEFLQEIKKMPEKNLAYETLKRLLNEEIKIKQKKNLVEGKSFLDLLEKTINKYTTKSIDAAQALEELVEVAKELKKSQEKGKKLDLTEDEVAFYDALETNDSAVKIMGDENLRIIAKELLKTIKENVTIDWSIKENVQANIRVLVKKILKKFGYPPDKQKKATETILEQAKLTCQNEVSE